MTLIRLSAFLSALAIFVGYFGVLHPLLDSIGIGRPLAAIWLLISAFTLKKYMRILSMTFAIFALIPILFSLRSNAHIENAQFTLYQHNLLFTNTAPDLALVTQQLSPDVITLQEISKSRDNVESLPNYSNQIICKFATVGDVGVLSKHTFIDQGCSQGEYRGFAWARIKNEAGEDVTVVSIHTHWPYPFNQAKQLEEIIPQLEKLPRPIILAGDFNQVSWSHAISALAKSVDGAERTGLIFTLVRPPLFLPIDHIIAPAQAKLHIEKLNRYGSDHNGLFARFESWPR